MLSLHKLTAGTGYDYLTRQVAAMDSIEKGHTSLADYHDQRGESPGHWVGSGLLGIDGVTAGDVVTADQMLSLFGVPPTPTEVLESVLARDEASLSATSLRRQETGPAALLQSAADRYVDALGVAAAEVVGANRTAEIESAVGKVAPDLLDCPAWPVLKSQLLLLAASGANAIRVLETAVRDGGLDDARDPAAALSAAAPFPG